MTGTDRAAGPRLVIPDLPPDISFVPLPHTAEAIGFAFEVKRAAMGPHIVKRWTWDEAFQRELHERRFNEKPFFRIDRFRRGIGTISALLASDHLRLGEFYLCPEFQGQGTGTRILRHCLGLADELGLPVRLEHLHWNPVGSLYRRHGFQQTGTSDIHVYMERPPGRTGNASSAGRPL